MITDFEWELEKKGNRIGGGIEDDYMELALL